LHLEIVSLGALFAARGRRGAKGEMQETSAAARTQTRMMKEQEMNFVSFVMFGRAIGSVKANILGYRSEKN
jgi:hypothetical protein